MILRILLCIDSLIRWVTGVEKKIITQKVDFLRRNQSLGELDHIQ